MSTKYFCDECEQEMDKGEHERMTRKKGRVTIEVHRAVDNTWNGGHVCWSCILTTVNHGNRISEGEKP